MKKFVEDDVEVKFDSPIHLVQSVSCMLLTAPFKFIMAVSSKILYLPKEAQRKVVFNSAVVASLVTALNFAFQMYFNCFSLLSGRMPLIVMVLVSGLLWFGVLVVTAEDFSFHSQLADYLGEEDESSVEPGEAEQIFRETTESQSAVKQETAFKEDAVPEPEKETDSVLSDLDQPIDKEDIDSLFVKELDDELAQELAQIDLAQEDTRQKSILDANKFKNSQEHLDLSVISNSSKILSEAEMIQLKENLVKCTDPSKFLSGKLLSKFNDNQIVEDECNLDSLNLGIIPNGFRIFA